MAPLPVASLAQAGLVPPTDATGAAQNMPATSESGSDSAGAAAAGEQLGFAPSMATARQRHQAPEAARPDLRATAPERMAAQVRPPAGRAGDARRTVIVEPGCGQRKAGRGFRRFLLRGLDNIRGEGRLVCLTHHRRKLWRYTCAPCTVEAQYRALYVPPIPLCRASYHLCTDGFSPQSRWRQQRYPSLHPHRRAGVGSKGYIR
jgi:hypothetical protein